MNNTTLRGRVRKTIPWTIILISFLIFPVTGKAETHYLIGTNYDSGWTCIMTVSGTGLQFIAQDDDYNPPDKEDSLLHQLFVYIMQDQVKVQYYINYTGAEGEDIEYYINGQPGQELIHYDNFDPNSSASYQLGGQMIDAVVSWKEDGVDTNGDPIKIEKTASCQFEPVLQLWHPLLVTIENPYGAGNRRLLHSKKITPVLQTDDEGVDTVTQTLEDWGDVGVKVLSVDGSDIYPVSSSWIITDNGGHVGLILHAELDTSNMTDGWISGDVRIKAVKNGYKFYGFEHEFLPFAGVRQAEHVWMVDDFGQIQSAVVPAMALQRDQVIQIGTSLLPGSVTLVFCNGQEIYLQAEMTEGFRAVIGDGEVVAGHTLLSLDLRNKLQEIKDAPRRAVRMQIYKELGGLLDSTLGLPGYVGIFTETPGGALEKILAQWGEDAYTTNSSTKQYLSIYPRSTTGDLLTNAGPHTDISFNTDGSMYAENAGSSLLFGVENGEQAGVLAGSAIMLRPADSQHASTLTAPATSSTAWSAPLSESWSFSPAEGATVTTRTPDISIDTDNATGLVLETCRILLDNTNVTSSFTIEPAAIYNQFPVEHPLSSGSHTIALGCLTLKGAWEEQSVSFQVQAPPPAPETLEATPFSGGVWLKWQAVPDVAGYNVWRSSTTDGTKTKLTSVPLTQAGYYDQTPLPENYYWIESVARDDETALQATPVSCSWTDTLPAARPVGAPENVILSEMPTGVRIDFNDADVATRWLLERADTVDGPFTRLADQEDTLSSGFLDTTVVPGSSYVYRLSSLQMDGTLGQSVDLPFTFGADPSPPVGVSAVPITGGVQLRWNPYQDIRATGIRIFIYNTSTDSFDQIGDVSTGQTEFIDPHPAAGSWLYQLQAYNETEVSATVTVGASYYQVTSENAVINLPGSSLNVHEGDGTIMVPVTRSGNLEESATIVYQVWHANKGQAVEDVDFVKSAGLLVFEPHQETAEIPVTLLTDAESEWAEAFGVSLLNGYGSTVAGSNCEVDIIIEDSDLIMFGDYQNEITVNEIDGPIQIRLDRIWPSQHEVSVELAIDDSAGSAVAGTDYVAFTPRQITFPAGQATMTATIELLDDEVQDGTRVLHVRLQNPEGGAAVDPYFGTLAININDSDSYTTEDNIGFARSEEYIMEDEGKATITVTRLNGKSGEVSVNFASADGTAVSGSDYTAVSGTLTWADGEGGDKTFEIPVLNDEESEGDQTFNLTLSSPAGGAILGERTTCMVTIMDDDFIGPEQHLQFSAASYTVHEDDGQVAVTVTRTGESAGSVSVNYATSDGSAVAGNDYAAASGTLTWADGDEDDKVILITVQNDSNEESDETINITLSDPGGGALLGTPSTAVLLIKDDDRPPEQDTPFPWNLFMPSILEGN
jgi:hypothetical protein